MKKKINHSILASLQSVGVRRNNQWLVQNIDLTVHRGEIVSLIGPNGSGKTTVTKILAGSLQPDFGRVQRSPNIKIGYVPQNVTLNSSLPMTVQRLMNVPHPVDRSELIEVLDELNIQHLANSPVQKLSGGEFQRVLLARALLRKPDLMILDEPTQGLDVHGETLLFNRIANIRDRMNCGILIVRHDLHLVMVQTDTVVCMNVHICCTGTPKRVQENEAYLNLFGAKALEGRALYSHKHDHDHRLDGSIRDL